MKKYFKNNLKLFAGIIIGVVAFGSIVVYASSILANDISFTPKDNTWEVSNVEDAINSLYSNINKDNLEFFSGVISTSSGGLFYTKNIDIPENTKKVTIESYMVSSYSVTNPVITSDSNIDVTNETIYSDGISGRYVVVKVINTVDILEETSQIKVNYYSGGYGGHFVIGKIKYN